MLPGLIEVLTLGGIGAAASAGLYWASKKFYVYVDPKEEDIYDILPHVDCAGCGFPGCRPFASAVIRGDAPVTGCTVGGGKTAQDVATIMGVDLTVSSERKIARLYCEGGCAEAKKRFVYDGIKDCKAAVLVGGGDKACTFGCLGYGDCVRACTFDAMYMNDNELPVILEDKCVSCELCVPACPVDLIRMVPVNLRVDVLCNSLDKGPVTKKVCTVGCISCDICVKACPYEAVTIENYLAKIDPAKCTNCGLCIPVCPTGIIYDLLETRPKAAILDGCTGCTLCRDICPTDAIVGHDRELHTVIPDKCIGCEMCVRICPEDVVEMRFPGEGVSADTPTLLPLSIGAPAS